MSNLASLPLKISEVVSALLLAIQLLFIASIPFTATRFFCWAPHDVRVDFDLSASHHGRPVPLSEIAARYHLPAIEWHALGNIFAVIETAEQRLPEPDRWQVTVRYRRNLAAPRTWQYPQHNP